jgi:4-phosphopantoate--beta-alanine ligase
MRSQSPDDDYLIWITVIRSEQFPISMQVSKDHPRYRSLAVREILSDMVKDGIVAPSGLIAHGRGEAFDYLLGEETSESARCAEKVAVAQLLEARNPIISVNGNVAALTGKDIVTFSELVEAKIEVNLFHRSAERVEKVVSYLESIGAKKVLGRHPDAIIPGIASDRAKCMKEGIFSADVVFVPLEDGDRAEALVQLGKKVIAIDLNPLSRTARVAQVTIVDEVTRAIPNMIAMVPELSRDKASRRRAISDFNNRSNLKRSLELICNHLTELAKEGKP